ncbi:MAG TPA: hypothetical protein VII23_22825 [Terriglobales bacterium]
MASHCLVAEGTFYLCPRAISAKVKETAGSFPGAMDSPPRFLVKTTVFLIDLEPIVKTTVSRPALLSETLTTYW